MKQEAQKIQEYLDMTCSNNPEEIKDRMADLMVYMSRSGEMLARAKRALNDKKASEISNLVVKIAKENFLSASAQNAMVKAIASEEQELVDWLDRINASCVHQIDALRSLLSYEKEQLRLNNTGY